MHCTVQIVEMCQTGKLSNWFLRPRRIAVTGDLFSRNNECLYLPYPRDSICNKERKICWIFDVQEPPICGLAKMHLALHKRCQGKLHRFSSESWVVCLIYCVKIASIFFILTLISDKLWPGQAIHVCSMIYSSPLGRDKQWPGSIKQRPSLDNKVAPSTNSKWILLKCCIWYLPKLCSSCRHLERAGLGAGYLDQIPPRPRDQHSDNWELRGDWDTRSWSSSAD